MRIPLIKGALLLTLISVSLAAYADRIVIIGGGNGDTGRDVNCPNYDGNRQSCEAFRECAFDRRTGYCDEDYGQYGFSCSIIPYSSDCDMVPGCSWDSRDRRCSDDYDRCASIERRKSCRATDGCSWDGDFGECYEDRRDDDDDDGRGSGDGRPDPDRCADQFSPNACNTTRDCRWDDRSDQCRDDI